MLRTTHLALAAGLALGLAGASGTAAYARPAVAAGAVIKDVDGKVIGTVQIDRFDETKLRITVQARGLTPGFHGFHIHTSGVCNAKSVDKATGSAFASAGGHFEQHMSGDAKGNLPSLLATSDGVASASFLTDRFTLDDLRDRDGSSVIIHAKADNFANVPDRYFHQKDSAIEAGPDATTIKTGDAGRRIGCGVIRVFT